MKPRLWLALLAGALGVYAWFSHFPTRLGIWPSLMCLVALVPAGLAIHLWSDRDAGDRKRLFGPLALFTVAFVGVLAPRALTLALGEEGRYFEQTGSGQTISRLAARLEDDLPETSAGQPVVQTDARRDGLARGAFPGRADTIAGAAFTGAASARLRFTSGRGGRYVAASFPGVLEERTPVAAELPVAASAAVRATKPLPQGTAVELYLRYFDTEGVFLADRAARGRSTRVTSPSPGRWVLLEGRTRAPPRAATAQVLVLVRIAAARRVHELFVDAPLVVPGSTSTRPFLPGAAGPSPPFVAPDALLRALAIAIALLAAVFAGYVLPFGGRLSSRVPQLDLPSLRERGTYRTVLAMTLVGLCAYAVDIGSYGGYGDYLESLGAASPNSMGRWYLRALALLPTGAAVVLLARRLKPHGREPWRWLEIVTVALGVLIPLSYLLKTPLVIPLLQVLLFFYFVRRRALIWLALAALATATLTPLVYHLRGRGLGGLGYLFSGDYWRDFGTNVLSRFFHFESLMIAVPFRSTEAFWQPAVEFASSAVPRVLWEGKPLSPATRFTQEHLLSGLHTGTDTGTISLPGELWLMGGPFALLAGGLLLGCGLRVVHAITRREVERGTLLIAAGLLSGLIFVNDGWGLSSALIHLLIASVGWLVLLRPATDGGHIRPAALSR